MFEVGKKVLEAAEREVQVYPCNSNRASMLGDPCERKLVFWRTRWQEAKAHDGKMQILFEQGSRIEEQALEWLKKAGFTVTELQRPFSWPAYNITGKVDAKISKNGSGYYPVEVKGLSPNNFNIINCWEDLFSDDLPVYMRKYATQLICYMLMDNKEWGLFYPINKVTGLPKENDIWIPLNDFVLDYAEKNIIQKAERINRHVAEGTVPPPIEYDEKICGNCEFLHICCPDMQFKGAEILDLPELRNLLERREALIPFTEEYEAINSQIKEMIKGHSQVIVDRWVITVKEVERTNYNVPKEIKEQYAEKKTYQQVKIQKLKS